MGEGGQAAGAGSRYAARRRVESGTDRGISGGDGGRRFWSGEPGAALAVARGHAERACAASANSTGGASAGASFYCQL